MAAPSLGQGRVCGTVGPPWTCGTVGPLGRVWGTVGPPWTGLWYGRSPWTGLRYGRAPWTGLRYGRSPLDGSVVRSVPLGRVCGTVGTDERGTVAAPARYHTNHNHWRWPMDDLCLQSIAHYRGGGVPAGQGRCRVTRDRRAAPRAAGLTGAARSRAALRT